MEGTIRVNPQDLISKSQEFANVGNQVNNLTQQMLQLVRNTNSIWQGDDATMFVNKFNALEDDMQRIYRMIQEHSTDLNEMASRYMQGVESNVSSEQSLKEEVIS